MCIKKFDAENYFWSNLQGFNLVQGVSSKSYLLPSYILPQWDSNMDVGSLYLFTYQVFCYWISYCIHQWNLIIRPVGMQGFDPSKAKHVAVVWKLHMWNSIW